MEHHAQMSQNLTFLCRYYKCPFSQPKILYVQKMGDFPECLCQEVRKGKTLPADLSKLGTPPGLIVSGPEGILEPCIVLVSPAHPPTLHTFFHLLDSLFYLRLLLV